MSIIGWVKYDRLGFSRVLSGSLMGHDSILLILKNRILAVFVR